jgi:uncharacterized protein with PIN domain
MRFVADAMLGTLAKWLRILGYDCVFDTSLNDHQLVRLARAEDRVLLTRDTELARRRGLRVMLIEAEVLDDQVRQVLATLDLAPQRSRSRCSICNERLEHLDHEAAAARVPAYVAQQHTEFRACPACGRVYWPGTHWQQIDQRLALFFPEYSNGG